MSKSLILRTSLAFLLLCCLVMSLSGCFLLPNRPPVASFVVHQGVDPEDVLVVDLDASASSDPDGDAITAYLWTFGAGEGDGVDIITPLGFYSKRVTVDVLRVRYPGESTYTIELTVIDERNGVSDPVTQTIPIPEVQVGPTQ